MMRDLYRKLRLTLCFLLTIASAMAQERVITGTVTDETGATMPGVNVLLKGTSTGTATDVDGNFRISIPNDQATLVISFVGYATSEIQVGSRSVVNVQLAADVKTLTELVVTGYTIDTRRQTTGSVSTVKTKDLTIVPSGNVEQQLQGRVAGVTVVTNGQPGTASQIRVRGFGAFGGNEPLYIVDGLPVTSVDFLNPDDIESTTVLKDAASASIYGARAANGVIIYTTKKGAKSSKLNISYDGVFGATDPGKGIEMMNPTDFAEWTWNARRNTAAQLGQTPTFNHPQFGTGTSPVIPEYLLVGSASGVTGGVNLDVERGNYNVTDFSRPIYQVVRANREGTDWYDEITRKAPLVRNTIGINGGSDKSRFYIGMSMQDQAGILLHQHFKRYAFRANSEFNLRNNLRIGENLQFTYRQVRLLQGGSGGLGVSDDENDVLQAFRMPTIIPVYDEFGGYAGTRAAGFNNPRNPVANLDRSADNRGFNAGAFGNIYLEWDPLKDLTLRTSIGGNYAGSYFWSYFGRQYENSENNSAVTYSEGAAFSFGWTFTNTASYKKTFGDHNLDVIVGQEALNTGDGRNMSGTGLNPFSEDRDFVTLNTTTPGATRTVGSNYFKGVRFASYFGRVNYMFQNKYMVSVVVRRDGSSRFGAENRYGTFPAFSFGWRISEEGFMDGLSFVDDLKIRGGYGIMGNSNNVDPNNQYSLYATTVGNSSYPISNTSPAVGFFRSRIGNPSARWEKAITTNIGFDGTLFNGKLDVIFDLWRKDTEDLLFQVPITATNGPNATPPTVNIGKMLNQGVDLQIINRGEITTGLGYEVTVNGGFLKNEIVELAPGITYLSGGNNEPSYRGIVPIRNQIGRPISSFFGYEVVGLFQSAEEVNSAPTQAGAAPGRFRYRDINGDGVINTNDRTWLGSPVPKFTGGLNFKLTYKNFELECYSFLSQGNKIFNVSRWFTDFYPSFAGASIAERVKDSWTPQNTGATIPIFENVSNFSTNTQSSSYYVEPGSYFRLQNISLGYNVPSAMLNRMSLSRLRVFAGLNNVFTITKYEGLDPSVGGDADTRFGVDVGNYPITRSWTVGLSVGF
ncbi:MAG: SusC/RagA family TonB-linked outer membrane protein [Bacteroidota bacterium]